MDRNELVGTVTTFGGSLAACTAPLHTSTETVMLTMLSALGALAAVIGLVYTVWNGNRNFKLAQREFALKEMELAREVNQRLDAKPV